MATVNKQSLREEFDALKGEFERLCASGKMTADSRALFQAMLMLFEVLMVVFMEKRTPKNSTNSRCQPWRAKRRLVDPSSREAALFSRRALRQRENKVGLRTRRPVIWEPSTEQQRACEVVAQCWVTRTAGAQIGCQRPSRFLGLGCPKIYHEAEDTLVSTLCIHQANSLYQRMAAQTDSQTTAREYARKTVCTQH